MKMGEFKLQNYFLTKFKSAIIILPNEKIDINKYIESLTTSNLYELINRLYFVQVQIELPKFEIEFSKVIYNVIQE